MRAFILLLSVLLLFTSPVIATVVLISNDLGGGEAELFYDSSEEPSLVRCFSLDISVSSGVILSTDNWSSDYWLFPGSVEFGIDPETGETIIINQGTPVASGLGTSQITIEMASLYHPSDPNHNTPPSVIGILLNFHVSKECDVIITENAQRGGVVLEDPTSTDIYAPPCHIMPEPATFLMFGLGSLIIFRECKSKYPKRLKSKF